MKTDFFDLKFKSKTDKLQLIIGYFLATLIITA